jgi:hypothetical protein
VRRRKIRVKISLLASLYMGLTVSQLAYKPHFWLSLQALLPRRECLAEITRGDFAHSLLLKAPWYLASAFSTQAYNWPWLDTEGAWIWFCAKISILGSMPQGTDRLKEPVVCQVKVLFPRSCLECQGTRDANVSLFRFPNQTKKKADDERG